jgi:serine/threonine protein phosphatase PrpC
VNARLPVRSVISFGSPGERHVQEDFAAFNDQKGIFALADGFGGRTSGPESSRAACESVLKFLQKEAGDLEATLPFVLRAYFSLAGNVLFNSVLHANQAVMRLNKGKSVNERGGASLIAGFLDGNLLALANVGVCSAHLLREGRAADLVIPRSYARLVDPFSVVPSPESAMPLTALGMTEDLEPEIFEYRLSSGDWLILKTDGFGEDILSALAGLQSQGVDSARVQETLKAAILKENSYLLCIQF